MRYAFNSRIILAVVLCGSFPFVQESKPSSPAAIAIDKRQNDFIAANEAAAIETLRALQSAEATFQSTTGNGRYGGMQELLDARLIDREVAKAHRSGYQFGLIMKPLSPASRSSFIAVARPVKYGETGRRSFYIDESGVLNFSAQRNATVAMMEPLIDDDGGITANEASAIATLRTIYSAEATFQATTGNETFGSLNELAAQELIDVVLASGRKNGYLFKMLRVEKNTRESSSAFEVIATPVRYGETGLRSFYLDELGTIRAADRKGLPASAQDEPLDK